MAILPHAATCAQLTTENIHHNEVFSPGRSELVDENKCLPVIGTVEEIHKANKGLVPVCSVNIRVTKHWCLKFSQELGAPRRL